MKELYTPTVNQADIESKDTLENKIKTELKELGINGCPQDILESLSILERNSKLNGDSRMIRDGIKNVLENMGSFKLTPIERKRVVLAAYLHDIGKSSSSKDPECKLVVVKLFSVEGIKNPNQTVNQTLQLYFPSEEVDNMILNLYKADVSPSTTMREFWDKHAFWTKEILDRSSEVFDKETRIVAASHHLDRKINPYAIDIENVEEVSNELKYSIFLLIAMDKYQAYFRRGGMDHKKSMECLRNDLRLYDGDDVMKLIVTTIDQLGGSNSLFSTDVDSLKKNSSEKSKGDIIK